MEHIQVIHKQALTERIADGLAVRFTLDGRTKVFGFSTAQRRDDFMRRIRINGGTAEIATPSP